MLLGCCHCEEESSSSAQSSGASASGSAFSYQSQSGDSRSYSFSELSIDTPCICNAIPQVWELTVADGGVGGSCNQFYGTFDLWFAGSVDLEGDEVSPLCKCTYVWRTNETILQTPPTTDPLYSLVMQLSQEYEDGAEIPPGTSPCIINATVVVGDVTADTDLLFEGSWSLNSYDGINPPYNTCTGALPPVLPRCLGRNLLCWNTFTTPTPGNSCFVNGGLGGGLLVPTVLITPKALL